LTFVNSEIFVFPALDLWQYLHTQIGAKVKQSSRTSAVRDTSLFQRYPISRHAQLTELRCSTCSSFLGASIRPELLDFLQKVHSCKLQGDPFFLGIIRNSIV
jgi:hypothetical protein